MTAGTDDFAALASVLGGIATLPGQELEHLRRHAEVRTFHAGQALLDIGETPTRCWFLASGFLRFFYITESGREYNKAFSRPGEIVVPLSAMLAGTTNAFVIAAITDVRTLAFPVSLVPTLYLRHPAWERIGRVLAEQMAMRKETRERELLLDSALTRFRRFAERYPELVDWIPQRQIASYIGVTEQALSRLLREWRGQRTS
ncbi:Crp/Fnr family transcriptional regulator [Luteimonas salinilitoris]|uniref:Crp/Fnr family transcriptional regulator n=1 Tax=Luteimonas salinilitoris TaxID=3237697 RepID=A0ABV4HRX8_9GAMM